MADAAYAIPNFYGGEISAFAQGRFDKPDYRTSLNVCLNALPIEIGAWARRPGTMFAGHTRGGNAGRTIKFDFEQSNAITLEFTDSRLRFRSGATLVRGNDAQVVVAVSAANPAVVQTASAVTWDTGDTLVFPERSTPLLENRQFTATKVDTTHFSLADSISGATIDGATLGALVAGATVARVHELTTVYTGGSWSGVRAVQAKTTDILLSSGAAPQALTVTTLPATGINPVFAIAPAVFNDGPYLDPFTNGVQATPGGKTGIVTISLSFPAYDATKAYKIGDFVTSAAVNYISLVDQNVGSAPPSVNWAATAASAAINDGRGFLGTDVGRLVRMFSEPAAWAVGTAYAASTAAAPVVVGYNASGLPGGTLYYSASVASTGKIPGTDLQNWTLIPQGAAIWTWGKITSMSNTIDRALAGSANIGDMIQSGGLAAAFDGVYSQATAACAVLNTTGGFVAVGGTVTFSTYVGKNYSGATDQVIQQATVYPSTNEGFMSGSYVSILNGSVYDFYRPTVTLNLRGKASVPASASDGTLLGTSGSFVNTTSAVTIASTDQVTAWKYVWIEQISSYNFGTDGATSYAMRNEIAEVSFFAPPGTGTGTGVNVQLLGPPLLYTLPIMTWRLGVYSNTTGWPTCGTYDEGRLWLGGVVKNRFDASVSNGIDGGTINFAPTNQYGTVAADNAISYTLNARDANQIVWMSPEEGGLVMGTQAGEWLVRAPLTGSISPFNISARRITKIGAANLEPYRTEHANIFVHRYRRKLTEYFPDANSGKFTGPNLADKAGQIASRGIAEIAYTSSNNPVIWGRDDGGRLFGITYKRDAISTAQPPTYYGWHRHTLGSGRTVESICSGPSPGGDLDTLTMVTNDATIAVRHVELLTDTPNENATLASSWFLDSAVNPTSSTAVAISVNFPYGGITLNGLWHLNGKTVQVFAGGLDCGDPGEGRAFVDFLVANGSLTIAYGDGISPGAGRGLFTEAFFATLSLSQIVVGFTYNSDGQMVRPIMPADTGARNGPALGKTRRSQRYAALLSNTYGISFGTEFTTASLKPAMLRTAAGDPIAALTTFSGVHSDLLTDNYSYDSMICWRVSRPWPAVVVALEAFLQTQDR